MFYQVTDNSPIAFGPRVDIEREQPFLPMKPQEIIRSGNFSHVPFITGVTANEAGFAVASKLLNLNLLVMILTNMTIFLKGIASHKDMEKLKEFKKKPDLFLNYGLGLEFDSAISNKTLQVYHNYFPNQTESPDLNIMEHVSLFFTETVSELRIITEKKFYCMNFFP